MLKWPQGHPCGHCRNQKSTGRADTFTGIFCEERKPAMKIETVKLWEDRDDVELTTFLTMPDPFIPHPAPKPAVIVCPGGAYETCPRHGNEGDPVAMSFAADGYQAFVLEYSVSTRAPEGKTLFPAQLIDFGKAILTIREHAEEWSVDCERISIIGFSAGAHLCGTLATRWQDGTLSDTFGMPSEVFKPLVAMLIYPITDYTIQEPFRKTLNMPFMDLAHSNLMVFGTENPDEDMQIAASPARHVTKDCPPIFLAAARDDGLVTAENSLAMACALQKEGIPYELHMFENGDHGFSLGRHLIDAYRSDKAHACAAWLPMAKTFLLHHVAPETACYEKNPFEEMMNEAPQA